MSISLGSTSISNAYLGTSAASAIYLGNTQVWTSTITIGPDTVYLGGLGGLNPAFLQSQLETKLDGETITSFVSQSGNVYATSTSDFTILGTTVSPFNGIYLTAYEDGGRCTELFSTAFRDCTSLRSVTMPSCSIVGENAFFNNSSLTAVNLPLAASIGRSAFNFCSSLRQISLPSVTEVESNVFFGCTSLTSIDLPALTTIFDYRFKSIGSLVTASFASATEVGQSAFQSCTSLSSVSTFPELLSIGTSSFQSCRSLVDTAPMFPKVTTIANLAFYGCTNYNNFTGLTSASFVSASTVGDGAFFGCNYLSYINLPALSGPTALGGTVGKGNYGVFGSVYTYGTASVPSDYLSNNGGKPDGDLLPLVGRNQDGTIDPNSQYNWTINYLPTDKIFIGGAAGVLDQATLQGLLTGETITYYAEDGSDVYASSSTEYTINTNAFSSLTIPVTSYIDGGKCTSIGYNAFSDTNIQTASFANATTASQNAFSYSQLAILNMPKLVTTAISAFEGTPIVTADLPELTTVGNRAFLGCYALRNIRAEKVTSIGQYAFANDTQLTSLSFPNATSVGLGAFHANIALTYLDLPGLVGPNALGGSPGYNGVFQYTSAGGTIRVPRYYQTNNGGGVDGDIQYLIDQGWFIIWVEPTIPTVVIGTQQWSTVDLDATEYANGETIPEVTDQTEWSNLTTGAWCWYNNDNTKTKLYNWYAVNDPRGLAPAGFHIPSDAEWTTLTDYLGANAGGQLKEAGLDHWNTPNTGATNSSGFTALPGGLRVVNGAFYDIGDYGYWWSSTDSATNIPWNRLMSKSSGLVDRSASLAGLGLSVRLIKNQ